MAVRASEVAVEISGDAGAGARVTQSLLEAAAVGSPAARVSAAAVEALGITEPQIRVTQALLEAGVVGSAALRLSAMAVEVLVRNTHPTLNPAPRRRVCGC